jgi:hypothetical protein
MDKSHGTTSAYETRDADARGVFWFLVVMGLALVFTLVLCWALFRYFSATEAEPNPVSPFAETRQLPSGPQLQVNPREDWLKFHAAQQQALESYAWEDREAGTVRVPVERAMELLLEKGVPVAGEKMPAAAGEPAPKDNPSK